MKANKTSKILSSLWLWVQFIWDYCWNSPYLRFLNIGFVNLAFLLSIGVLLDILLRDSLPTFLIALLVSIFHVTFSFVSRKIFIYKTRGNWLKEYLRCYMVYGGSILIYALLTWLFVDGMHMYFIIGQILALLSGNLYYSFASYFYFMPKPDLSPETGELHGELHEELHTAETIKQDTIKTNITTQDATPQNTNTQIPPTTYENMPDVEQDSSLAHTLAQEHNTAKKRFAPIQFLRKQKELFFEAFEKFKQSKIK